MGSLADVDHVLTTERLAGMVVLVRWAALAQGGAGQYDPADAAVD
jgi:hypothetical protein